MITKDGVEVTDKNICQFCEMISIEDRDLCSSDPVDCWMELYEELREKYYGDLNGEKD